MFNLYIPDTTSSHSFQTLQPLIHSGQYVNSFVPHCPDTTSIPFILLNTTSIHSFGTLRPFILSGHYVQSIHTEHYVHSLFRTLHPFIHSGQYVHSFITDENLSRHYLQSILSRQKSVHSFITDSASNPFFPDESLSIHSFQTLHPC